MQTQTYINNYQNTYNNHPENVYIQQQTYNPTEKYHTITKTKTQLKVISPQQMLQSLLYSVKVNEHQNVHINENTKIAEGEVQEEIKNIRLEINNLRSEVVEVENLLNLRDSLYQQLDNLRQQRQQIQTEIESTVSIDKNQTVKVSGGYKQMNERLRRRIYQIRQYIQKMSEENIKIQSSVANHQFLNQQEQIYHLRRQIDQPINQRTIYDNKRFNKTNFQQMMSNLHEKQQEAWRRVRRQQQDIDRRNLERRSSKGNNFTYYSPKARTYYSPGRQIY